jgi:hypothetical protein
MVLVGPALPLGGTRWLAPALPGRGGGGGGVVERKGATGEEEQQRLGY